MDAPRNIAIMDKANQVDFEPGILQEAGDDPTGSRGRLIKFKDDNDNNHVRSQLPLMVLSWRDLLCG